MDCPRSRRRSTSAPSTAGSPGCARSEVAVKLPRFKIEPGEALGLASVLGDLGMPTAFAVGTADFTGMAPRPEQLVISEAISQGVRVRR